MARDNLPPIFASLLKQARRVADDVNAISIVLLADATYDFKEIRQLLRPSPIIVASAVPEVQDAAKADEIPMVPLMQEPQTRQVQLTQALLEAVADNLLKTGDRVIVL